MTEKRFYLMNVEDPLHEYGRWCKPVLEDGETMKQYENALEVMDLLNEFNDVNEQLKQFKDKTFNLLDKEIAQNEEAIEWAKEVGADIGSVGFYNHMLNILKKELQE